MNLKSLAVICAACVWSLSAQAEVLVYEGFDTVSDYKGADAKKGSALNSGPATRTQSIGLSADKWGLAGGTQPRFFANDKGLSLPSAMIDAGFSALGTAIGFNPASTTAQVRPAYKKLADNLLKRDSGSLFAVSSRLTQPRRACSLRVIRSPMIRETRRRVSTPTIMAQVFSPIRPQTIICRQSRKSRLWPFTFSVMPPAITRWPARQRHPMLIFPARRL